VSNASADMCRARGWVAGDLLVGRGDNGVLTISLCYIGKDVVIAKCVRDNGFSFDGRETLFNLELRKWRRVRRG